MDKVGQGQVIYNHLFLTILLHKISEDNEKQNNSLQLTVSKICWGSRGRRTTDGCEPGEGEVRNKTDECGVQGGSSQ